MSPVRLIRLSTLIAAGSASIPGALYLTSLAAALPLLPACIIGGLSCGGAGLLVGITIRKLTSPLQ